MIDNPALPPVAVPPVIDADPAASLEELAPRIRVNCLIPGMTETDELVGRFHLTDPQARSQVLEEIPQRRIAQRDDIADALEYLVGPHSAYVTGQKLIVDGGQFMW